MHTPLFNVLWLSQTFPARYKSTTCITDHCQTLVTQTWKLLKFVSLQSLYSNSSLNCLPTKMLKNLCSVPKIWMTAFKNLFHTFIWHHQYSSQNLTSSLQTVYHVFCIQTFPHTKEVWMFSKEIYLCKSFWKYVMDACTQNQRNALILSNITL